MEKRSREEREERWRGWMIAAQKGDGAAYEKLLTELLPEVRGFVARRLRDVHSREDVVQNVLMGIHRARHTFRAERPFGPWLYAVARNAVTDHLRARARRQQREILLESPEPPDASAPPAVDEELSPELQEALEALPAQQREAVLLLHVEGLSVEEASLRVGASKGALKVRAHRGYRALRQRLGADPEAKP